MKTKKNFNKMAVIATTMIAMAALVQACGKAGDNGAVPQYGAPGYGGIGSGISGVTNQQLFGACQGPMSAIPGYSLAAQPQMWTSSDGTSVCRISLETVVEYTNGNVPYMNLGISGPVGAITGIVLNPYDQVSFLLLGDWGTGAFAGCNFSHTFGSEVDGNLPGIGKVNLGTIGTVTIPASATSGPMSVGVNLPPTNFACFDLRVIPTITRCVDASGNPHPCS